MKTCMFCERPLDHELYCHNCGAYGNQPVGQAAYLSPAGVMAWTDDIDLDPEPDSQDNVLTVRPGRGHPSLCPVYQAHLSRASLQNRSGLAALASGLARALPVALVTGLGTVLLTAFGLPFLPIEVILAVGAAVGLDCGRHAALS